MPQVLREIPHARLVLVGSNTEDVHLRRMARDLGVMDHAAISLARENHIPVLVFSIYEPGAFAAGLRGKGKYTLINGEE